jgi:hypothetical protein
MRICPKWWHISNNVKATSTHSSEQTRNFVTSYFKISWLSSDNLRYNVAITFLDSVHLSQGFMHPKSDKQDARRQDGGKGCNLSNTPQVRGLIGKGHLKLPLIVVDDQTCIVFFSELLIAVFPEITYLALMAPGVKLN